MTNKLDHGQKHFLRLIAKGADAEGWANVSAPVMNLMKKMPAELVDVEENINADSAGRARLTKQGQEIINAIAWL